MPQGIVFLDDYEDNKVKKIAKKIKLSKAETIRKIIRVCDASTFKEETK